MKIEFKDKHNVTLTMTESELKELYKGSFKEFHNKIKGIVTDICETSYNKGGD